jgi:hypothetical protein
MWKSIMSWISSGVSGIFSSATTYIVIAVAVISAGLSGYGVYKIEHAKVAVLQMQNQQLLDANLSSEATVTALKKERVNANATCQKQIAIQESEVKTCKELLALEGVTNEKPNASSSGDSILDKLNELFPKAGGQGSVCSMPSGTSTGTSSGLGSGVLRCFSSDQDAINFIMNKTEHDARESRMEVIIESHQTPTSSP